MLSIDSSHLSLHTILFEKWIDEEPAESIQCLFKARLTAREEVSSLIACCEGIREPSMRSQVGVVLIFAGILRGPVNLGKLEQTRKDADEPLEREMLRCVRNSFESLAV